MSYPIHHLGVLWKAMEHYDTNLLALTIRTIIRLNVHLEAMWEASERTGLDVEYKDALLNPLIIEQIEALELIGRQFRQSNQDEAQMLAKLQDCMPSDVEQLMEFRRQVLHDEDMELCPRCDVPLCRDCGQCHRCESPLPQAKPPDGANKPN